MHATPPRPPGWDRERVGCLPYVLVLLLVAGFWGGVGVLAAWLTTL